MQGLVAGWGRGRVGIKEQRKPNTKRTEWDACAASDVQGLGWERGRRALLATRFMNEVPSDDCYQTSNA
jgi:hypothetical protein